MSVYVVNIKEQNNGNKALCKLADAFKGDIFYRDSSYGSLMVHEKKGTTPDEQRDSVREYFAARSIPVTELANEESGHVVFEVDLATAPKKDDAADFQL